MIIDAIGFLYTIGGVMGVTVCIQIYLYRKFKMASLTSISTVTVLQEER